MSGPCPTLAVLAEELGVSRTTVSNAFSRPDQLSPALRDRILAAPTIAARFAAAEGWLLEQCRGELPLSGTVAHLAALLERPGLRVRDAVDTTGLGERQVRNLFNRWIGISPKAYARIARFQRVLLATGAVAGSKSATLVRTPGERRWRPGRV